MNVRVFVLFGRTFNEMAVSPASGNSLVADRFVEDVFDFRSRTRRAEEIALSFIAALPGQARKLLLRLHAFSRRGDPETAAQTDHGTHDGDAVFF